MAKKKGGSRHPRGGRTTPKGTQPRGAARPRETRADPETRFFDYARHLLRTDDPVEAEVLASRVVAAFGHAPPQRGVDVERATEMVDALGGTAKPEALALLLGLGAVGPAPLAASARWKADRHPVQNRRPAWADHVGRAAVAQCWLVEDVFGDGADVVLGCRYPDGHEHTVLACVDTNLGGIVKDAFVGPPMETALGAFRRDADDSQEISITEIGPADASARLRRALKLTDMTFPPIETETYPAVRALLDARLATMPEGADVAEPKPWPESARDELVAEFLTSPEAEDVTDCEDRADVAAQLVFHGCDFDASGDPLRWSPVVAEIVMLDWWPRKVVGDRYLHVQMPAVTKTWVRFAGRKRGLRPELVRQTLDAIDALGAEFLDRIDDPTAWGPAKALVQDMTEGGVDLADESAVGAFIDEFNARTRDRGG